MKSPGPRNIALGLAVVVSSLVAHADVMQGPTEYQITSRARWIQGIAAIRVTWAAFLDAMIAEDMDTAAKFLLPEKRSTFLAASGRGDARRLRELRSKLDSMVCRLESETSGTCTVTLSTETGNLEDVRLPTIVKEGVWYLTW